MTSCVNCFTERWNTKFNWLCPPIDLVGETLTHMKICKSSGVLIVPEWKSAYFWPLLTPDGKVFYDFVKDCLVLDPYFISTENSIFSGIVKFRTLALLIAF